MERATAGGVSLVSPGGLLAGITRAVLESALDGELDAHLGRRLVSTRRPGGGPTSVTGTGRRPCRPRSGRCASRCPGIGSGRSLRGSCRSTPVGWTGSTRRFVPVRERADAGRSARTWPVRFRRAVAARITGPPRARRPPSAGGRTVELANTPSCSRCRPTR